MCKSDGRKKVPGISFHEIPADLALRVKWIKAIARKGWTPNTTSSYTVVCSKHFLPTDFKVGLKTRRLKRGVVPSVFEGRPPPSPPPAEDLPSDVNTAVVSTKPEESQPVYVVTVGSEQDADCPVLDPYVEEILVESEETGLNGAQNGTCTVAEIDDRQHGDTNGALGDDMGDGLEHARNQPASQLVPTSLCTEDPTRPIEKTVQGVYSLASQMRPRALRSIGTQADIMRQAVAFTKERQKFKRRERDMKARVEKLTQAVKEYKDEMQRLMEDSHVSEFLDVVNEADNRDVTARIILDQVVNFNKKRPTWSETTVKHCIVLRGLSSSAYQYIREEKMLKLPSRGTLSDFSGGGARGAVQSTASARPTCASSPATSASNPDSPLADGSAASPQREGDVAEADDASTMVAAVAAGRRDASEV